MKRYLVYGGHVTSKFDKQRHYVSPVNVAILFKVSPSECIYVTPYTHVNELGVPRGLKKEDFIVLHPKQNGDYSLRSMLRE